MYPTGLHFTAKKNTMSYCHVNVTTSERSIMCHLARICVRMSTCMMHQNLGTRDLLHDNTTQRRERGMEAATQSLFRVISFQVSEPTIFHGLVTRHGGQDEEAAGRSSTGASADDDATDGHDPCNQSRMLARRNAGSASQILGRRFPDAKSCYGRPSNHGPTSTLLQTWKSCTSCDGHGP